MTSRMAIHGIGITGGFGYGIEAALSAVQNGAGPNKTMSVTTPSGTVDYPLYAADPGPLKQFIAPGKLRRINKYSRLAAWAACMALQDAGRACIGHDANLAVIVASGYGASSTTFEFLNDVILEGDEFASPTQFSNSVHSSAASHITILLQIQGPCLTVTQFEMSVAAALINARSWLMEKRVDAVLLGAVDEINPVLLYCYRRFWDESVPSAIEPLNFEKQTAIPGEGATFLLLTRDEGQPPQYGFIDEVSWTHSSSLVLPEDAAIIFGADGHRSCGLGYRRILRQFDLQTVRTFSTITGSIPTGQLFDLALSAIAAQNGHLNNRFCSLKLDADLNLGLIRSSKD